ncbi:MAG: MBL fold metallo-hydrolase [Anaerolineales bacterium]|nr:MBL fold metallo-hydrolase [Anaerolineales bacterium]
MFEPQMEIYPGVHQIPGIIANVYLIVDPNGLVLIDVGLPRNEGRILKYIKGLGHSPEDIKNIFITHADHDHYGSLAKLVTITKAISSSSAIEAEAMLNGTSSRPLKIIGLMAILFNAIQPFFRSPVIAVDHTLTDGQILPILGGLQVVATPGHAAGHLSYYLPSHRVLFVGDSLQVKNGMLVASSGANTLDEQQAIESLKRQASFGVEIVCPGHGPVIFNAANRFKI